MAIVNKAITDQGGGDYRHTMLTVPTGQSYAITNIIVCNTYDPNAADPQDETCEFDLHLIPSTGSYSDTITSVVRRLSLPAGETFTFDTERVVLDEGDQVVINGSASVGGTGRLACTVSYMRIE
jgi:hypothetical protein